MKLFAVFKLSTTTTMSKQFDMLTALISYACDLTLAFGALGAAMFLHVRLLRGLMRAFLSFYDTTPTGRILARFSKDIETVDQTLPQTINDCFWCGFEVN